MTDLVGRTLGRFEIVSMLGAGGMGEVYRARDTELQRDVALKVLPESAAGDPDRLVRFEREARAVARLSHPNILEIHDVGHDNGVHYAVTELIEGDTLRERLRRGRLPLRKAVAIADAIARGLGAAHAQGVVHRDVKPENVMLTSDGRVKVLDFGIAALRPIEVDAEGTGASTLTGVGDMIGTVGYMAPEQLRGQPADARSDVFALGCVLYEMLTGERAFKGATPAETLVAVLHDEPQPLSSLVPDLPSAVDRVVMCCLEKEPAERFQSAADIALALRAAEGSRGHRVAARPAKARRLSLRVLAAAILGAAVVVAAGLAWRYVSLAPVELPEVKHVSLARFEGAGDQQGVTTFAAGLSRHLASSMVLIEEQTGGALWLAPDLAAPDALGETGAEWGATVAVRGRLVKERDRVRLTLAAVDPTSDLHIRVAELDQPPGNLSTLQTEPVLRVAELLEVELSEATLAGLEERTTNVGAAFDAYLTGLGLLEVEPSPEEIGRAVAELRRSVELDPLFTPARTALADAYLRQHEATQDDTPLKDGIEQAERAMTMNEPTCEADLVLARLYQRAGRSEERAAVLERAGTRCPGRAEVFLNLGHAYAALERTGDAERQYQRAIYLRPGYWPSHDRLARLYVKRGDYDLAVTQFRHAIECAPLNYKSYNNLGYVLHRLERPEESREMFERSLAIRPEGNSRALNNLGVLYFDDARFADAAAIYRRLTDDSPEDHLAWANLAYSLQSGGDSEGAEPCFRRALELAEERRAESPDDLQLLCRLANYHAFAGDRQEGLAILQQVVDADPKDPKIIGDVAGALEDLGDRERALEWVERAFAAGAPPSRFEKRPLLRDLVADPRYRELRLEAINGP